MKVPEGHRSPEGPRRRTARSFEPYQGRANREPPAVPPLVPTSPLPDRGRGPVCPSRTARRAGSSRWRIARAALSMGGPPATFEAVMVGVISTVITRVMGLSLRMTGKRLFSLEVSQIYALSFLHRISFLCLSVRMAQ